MARPAYTTQFYGVNSGGRMKIGTTREEVQEEVRRGYWKAHPPTRIDLVETFTAWTPENGWLDHP